MMQKVMSRGLLTACTCALGLIFALPCRAAEDRAVRSKVQPVYPELAKRMKIGGIVKVEATVDADGRVTDAKTISGNHLLGPAAEEAVRKWKFASGTGSSTVDIDINFAGAQ